MLASANSVHLRSFVMQWEYWTTITRGLVEVVYFNLRLRLPSAYFSELFSPLINPR